MIQPVQLTDFREQDTLIDQRKRFLEGRSKAWVSWMIEHEDGLLEVSHRQMIYFN